MLQAHVLTLFDLLRDFTLNTNRNIYKEAIQYIINTKIKCGIMAKKIIKKYEGKTKEEKRRMVISGGTEVLYFVCPLCGFNRAYKKYKEGRVNLSNIPLKDLYVLQMRVGGGRASGFFKVDGKSHTIDELKGNSEYRDLLGQIKARCKEILRSLK